MKSFNHYLKQVSATLATNENGELQMVQAGEVIKLQKPAPDTFTNNTMNNDGVQIADCTVCGAPSVIVGDHICKTVLDNTAPAPETSERFVLNNTATIEDSIAKHGYAVLPVIDALDMFIHIKSQDDLDKYIINFEAKFGEAPEFYNAYSTYGFDMKNAAWEAHRESMKQKRNAPIMQTAEARFQNIRTKYGVNESKMVTKLDWFKSIMESPDTKSSDEFAMSPEEITNETERLFARYNNDETMEDVRNMHPDYKTTESEDATNTILDRIFDQETFSDSTWTTLKPLLFAKFKTFLESEAS